MCLETNNNIEQEGNKGKHFTESERNKIEGFKQAKISNRRIAKLIGKSHGSVNKEVKRGTVVQRTSDLKDKSIYKANYAQMKAGNAKENHGGALKIGNDHD